METPQQTLPTGVVTFLLTDIEGSTRLWEREPDAMRTALRRHDAIVGACVRRQHGAVVKSKGEGDSVFSVFRHARDAVNAALIVQCALNMEKWPTTTPLRVRMAIHTGQVDLRDGDYVGPPVNRCARLRAMATGGQVLVSSVSAQLVRSQLPTAAELSDLGVHQLKDLAAPERVWRLTHPQMKGPAKAAPVALQARKAYLLTDHTNRTADGLEWGAGVTHHAEGVGDDARIRCYSSPKLAALLNPMYDRIRLPRLWEVTVDRDVEPGESVINSAEVKTTRQADLPATTAQDYARFAVLCAQAAFTEGDQALEFSQWAEGWLAGLDSSGVNARAIADSLESGGYGAVMAANAARAALHAARTTWLAGRARDEDQARAVDLAGEAIGLGLRLAHLDLAGLAERALKTSTGVPAFATR